LPCDVRSGDGNTGDIGALPESGARVRRDAGPDQAAHGDPARLLGEMDLVIW
jgi:hypothetical protein